jgi:hypothetical protein
MYMKNNYYGMFSLLFSKNRYKKEEISMNKKNSKGFKEDTMYEGKDKLFLDVDRIINEGMSGGSVHMREDTTNIEEARDLVEEEPPR